MRNMVRTKKHLPNAITLTNMSFGVLSILFSFYGNLNNAIYLILVASMLDRMDGMAARKFNTCSEIGIQLDSLADLISFVLAPALLVFMFEFSPLSGIALISMGIATLMYVLCGGYRLARFNTTGIISGSFSGIPTTVCGMFVAATMMFSKRLPFYVYGLLLVASGFMMISKLQIRKR